MAHLVDPDNGTVQKIEATSKAARVILYAADGSQLATVPISGNVGITGSVAVTGAFYQATQPVSMASAPTGAALEAGNLASILTKLTDGNQITKIERGSLTVTNTGATAAGVTLTLPAVASQFHNISFIRIEAYNTAARTGSATPVVVTTTNLQSLAYTFETAAAIGTINSKVDIYNLPMRSQTANTATTIICPATTGIIWRVTAIYSTSI